MLTDSSLLSGAVNASVLLVVLTDSSALSGAVLASVLLVVLMGFSAISGAVNASMLLVVLTASSALSSAVLASVLLVVLMGPSALPGGGSSPFHCSVCGVYTSSRPLLEAHFKGRRHLKQALEQADADAVRLGVHPGPAPDAAIPRFPLSQCISVLYCTILYYVILYCTTLKCTILYCTILSVLCHLILPMWLRPCNALCIASMSAAVCASDQQGCCRLVSCRRSSCGFGPALFYRPLPSSPCAVLACSRLAGSGICRGITSNSTSTLQQQLVSYTWAILQLLSCLGMHTGAVPLLFLRRTPTATQFYCEVCGVFATSEEQLVMHNEGKKHKRTVALKELTHGHLPSTPPNSTTGTGFSLN